MSKLHIGPEQEASTDFDLQDDPGQSTEEQCVVVGLDGRKHDADALALAEWLQPALEGPLLLVHVCPPAPAGVGTVQVEAYEMAEGSHILRRARRELRVSSEIALLKPTSASKGLGTIARDRGAKLLVLGSSHRGPVGRIVPGGVASQLLAHAPCAIAVAPVGFATQELGDLSRIGVAYDTTRASNVALRAATQAAKRVGASLHLYHAFYPVPEGDAWTEFRRNMEEFARSILDCGLRQLDPEIKATARALEGHVAETVSTAAQADGVDLLYVGSRGYGPLHEAVIGGVSGELLHTSRVPLVIVPRSIAASVQRDG